MLSLLHKFMECGKEWGGEEYSRVCSDDGVEKTMFYLILSFKAFELPSGLLY